KLYLRFIRECFHVPNNKIKIYLQCYADMHEVAAIEAYWLDVCGLEQDRMGKTIVNSISRASKGKRTNTLPYGTLAVKVGSTEILCKVLGAISGYGGTG